MTLHRSLSFILLALLSLNLQAGEREIRAWQLMDQGALVIDVRSTGEYAEAHLQDALHIPFQRIVSQLEKLEVRKDRNIVLYCRSGRRAGVAEEALVSAGYNAVFNGGGLEPLVEQRRNGQ